MLDEATGNLYLRAQANMGVEETKNFWVKVNDSIAGQVVHSGQPITLSRNSNSLKVKTGLTVYSLVNVRVKTFWEQQHNEIMVESQLNESTTFTITLPRTLPSLRS